jgi:hypothetical protein
MGTLEQFENYIMNRIAVVSEAEQHLLSLQASYETFFQEVSAVRDHEMQQLSRHVSEQRGRLPHGLDAALDAAAEKARAEHAALIARLQAAYSEHVSAAEQKRAAALDAERRAHEENRDLDAEEEALKTRNEQLCADIQRFAQAIREASGGFGFIVRLPSLRALQRERRRLEQEQLDVVARIERLRARWAERAPSYQALIGDCEQAWATEVAAASRVQTRIEHLRENTERMVGRTALERVLYERRPEAERTPGATSIACPRCRVTSTAAFFCPYCAARLGQDRTDLDGSLLELAELNQHHRIFSDGMRACQEFIALVRGIRSGLESFQRSVSSMLHTQQRPEVSRLTIDVPAAAVEQGRGFDVLLATVRDPQRRHPLSFAETLGQATRAFGQAELSRYFETMGQELTVQANRQWG